MKVHAITPRGYCQGVVIAIDIANKTIEKHKNENVYILGQLVHNKILAKRFSDKGATTIESKGKTRVDLLDDINDGVVIITAHGASDEVKRKAKEKNLTVVDATCKYVDQTHNIVKEKLKDGYNVVYLGKQGHPESEGVMGIDSSITLIETLADLDNINVDGKTFITNQTTLSYDLVIEIFNKAEEMGIEVSNEICDATKMRQQGVRDMPTDVDLVLVVGDVKSNNSNKLVELAKQLGKDAYLVESELDIKDEWFNNKNHCAITSGASTPTDITNNIIELIRKK